MDCAGKKQFQLRRGTACCGVVFRIGASSAALFTLVAAPIYAQTDLASIVGTITDSSGAAVSNCQVQVRNTQTSAVRTVTTDTRGFYSAPSLSVGSYQVTATASGFGPSAQAVTLTLSGATADLTLAAGPDQRSCKQIRTSFPSP